MRTATAQGGRAGERTAHRIAEKLAKNAGVDLGDWIEEALAEYADDLGVDPRELDERERLEAIEDRIDRLARAPSRPRRAAETLDTRDGRDAYDNGAQRRRDPDRLDEAVERIEKRARVHARPAAPRAAYAAEPDPRRLEQAVSEIERRAERNEHRTAHALDSLTGFVEAQGDARGRLEQAVAEIESRAERNEQRTARALESLAGLVEARGGERERLQQAVAEVESRAQKTSERTARALESLAGLVETRKSERGALEGAIERIGKRAEQTEARTARALESLAGLVQPAADAPEREDAVSTRLDALASRAARTPQPRAEAATPAGEDEETFRLVAERLARRRKPRGEPQRPAAPFAARGPAAPEAEPENDIAIERMERRLAELAAQMERLAGAAVAPPAAQPDARRPAPEPSPLEELARRVESIRAAVERQGARPDAAAFATALARLSEKLDRAATSGSQSAATMAALHGAIGRLEEAAQRPASVTLDARPIEQLAHRIEGVRGAIVPKVDEISAAVGELGRRIERPAAEIERLEAALSQLSAEVRAVGRAGVDMKPVAELARRIDAMREIVESQGAIVPKVDEISAAVDELGRKIERPAPEIERLETALRQLSSDVTALARPGAADLQPVVELARRVEAMRKTVESQGAIVPKVDEIKTAVGELGRRLERPAGEGERLEAALRQLSADVHALSRAGAVDLKPVEDLARRIDAMRKAVESHGALAPQVDRLEQSLAEICVRLDRPTRSPEIDAVDATLRQLALKFDAAMNRPATFTLDPKPIEDLARRIESVRESLDRPPAASPQADRLETALGAVADKLDRAQPTLDAQGISLSLAAMNARLEEAFRHPAQLDIDRQPIDALAARVEAVRATIERQTEQLDGVGRPIDELGKRLETLREAVERQAEQLDAGRLEDAFRDAAEKLHRPGVGPEEFRAIVNAIHALSAKIDGAASVSGDALTTLSERVSDRFEQPGEGVDHSALADAIAKLGEKFDRAGGASSGSLVEPLIHDVAARLDAIELKIDARTGELRPADDNLTHLELAVRELAEKVGEIHAVADTRGVEQEVRLLQDLLQDKLDDLAEARAPGPLAAETAQTIAREVGARLAAGDPAVIGHLHDLHGRLDDLIAARPTAAALEAAMIELTEELEAFRSAREAVGRGATTLSEIRAEQVQFDRRLDTRFAGVQDVLEKLVDRLDRNPDATAPVARAPSRGAMLDIPDRSGADIRPAPPPGLDPSQIAAPARVVDGAKIGADGAKTAAINAHIAAARRAANAAAADSERREEVSKARKSANGLGGGLAQRATTLFNQHRRPVLLGAAGVMTVLTGVAILEARNHTQVRKSELEAPASPAAQAEPNPPAADLGPTGSIASEPKVIASPLPPAPEAATKPDSALVAALPAGVGPALAAAASNGDIGAEVEIAQRYLEGRTVARDPRSAVQWMQTAADAGNVFALYRLGALYEKGVGVVRDAARAREMYTKAADAGNARAMHNLAVLYAQDGGAGKPDYAQAMTWFRKAGTYGVRDSQFNLGVLYGRGLGASQDLAESWMWFSVAARQGDADAARKRDEVANRMDGRAMAAAKQLLDAFKGKSPNPAVNDPPPAPASTAADAPKSTGTKS